MSNGGIAQLVRVHAWHAWGHWFDPSCLHQNKNGRRWRPFLFWRRLTRSKQLARSADLVRIPAEERVKLACKRRGVEYCNSLRNAKNCKCRLSLWYSTSKTSVFVLNPLRRLRRQLSQRASLLIYSVSYTIISLISFSTCYPDVTDVFCLSELKTISENCALHLKISVI